MNEKKGNWFDPIEPRRVCVGAGLVALDIVITSDSQNIPRVWAGGSCGNVLTILAFLGWDSYPVARLGNDQAANILIEDLTRWKVRTTRVRKSGFGTTPIIVHRIGTDYQGIPWHRFEWTCPRCGAWLPRYRPVPLKDIDFDHQEDLTPQVFYFDRSSPSSLELAKRSKEKGALVFFEPSGVGDKRLFSKCLAVSDIVKYSHERMGHVQEITSCTAIGLEIETLGSQGARYRVRKESRASGWQTVKAHPVKDLKDAAGSGDWCSAGIIHLLGQRGAMVKDLGNEDIDDLLTFGQALAALNCSYEGARGLMYGISKKRLQSLVNHVIQGKNPGVSLEQSQRENKVFELICPRCKSVAETTRD